MKSNLASLHPLSKYNLRFNSCFGFIFFGTEFSFFKFSYKFLYGLQRFLCICREFKLVQTDKFSLRMLGSNPTFVTMSFVFEIYFFAKNIRRAIFLSLNIKCFLCFLYFSMFFMFCNDVRLQLLLSRYLYKISPGYFQI